MSRSMPIYCRHDKCLSPGDDSFGLKEEHCSICNPSTCKHHIPYPFCDVCHQDNDGQKGYLEPENTLIPQVDDSCGIKDTQIGNDHPQIRYEANNDARSILKQASDAIQNRAITRDNSESERSMQRTVNIFNGLINFDLMTEPQGWLFMACVKLARSQQGQFHLDDYIDAAAYIALAGEAAARGPGND